MLKAWHCFEMFKFDVRAHRSGTTCTTCNDLYSLEPPTCEVQLEHTLGNVKDSICLIKYV